MTTINLKDFYYWYLTDELVEVPDEVAEEEHRPFRKCVPLFRSYSTCKQRPATNFTCLYEP